MKEFFFHEINVIKLNQIRAYFFLNYLRKIVRLKRNFTLFLTLYTNIKAKKCSIFLIKRIMYK